VSNEVGLGIVPVNELARSFRDVLGSVNARFAASADRALFMVAGRAIDLAAVESVTGAG
jgi:adenosyl cobinamide kinase/adenosyl cobinamide phosphate guanylyltransferase